MNQTLVLYRSKYGAAKKYAELLRAQTGCTVCEAARADALSFGPYRCIVFIGGIYASGIAGLSTLRRHLGRLQGKRVAVFAVGASPADEKALAALKAHNMKGPLQDIPLFYGRGAWNEQAMTFKDRTLCRLLRKAVSRKDPGACEPWEAALMEAGGSACDWTDPAYLEPLAAFLAAERP